MKIVIAGSGEVGSHLSKLLSKEDHDIIVIDRDRRRLLALDSYNLITHMGKPTSFQAMKYVGMRDCDLFIAVTPYETENVVACSIAKSLGARKTVARIDNYEFYNPENREYFEKAGVDDLIYPENLAAEEMLLALKHTWVRNWFELFNGELIVVGVKLRGNSDLVNKSLIESSSAQFMHICAIKRKHEILIPRGDAIVLEGDIVYIATKQEYIDQVIAKCGTQRKAINRVLIMGGSRIAKRLVRMSEGKYKFKII